MNASIAYQIQNDTFLKGNFKYSIGNKVSPSEIFEFKNYIEAISNLDDENEIKELFNMICEYDEIGIIDGRIKGDPNDIKGYAQYTLKLLVDMYPEVLSRKYKKLLFEFKLVGGNSNVNKNITNL